MITLCCSPVCRPVAALLLFPFAALPALCVPFHAARLSAGLPAVGWMHVLQTWVFIALTFLGLDVLKQIAHMALVGDEDAAAHERKEGALLGQPADGDERNNNSKGKLRPFPSAVDDQRDVEESLRRFHRESSRSLSALTIGGPAAGARAGDEAGGVISPGGGAAAFLPERFESGFGGERRDSLSQLDLGRPAAVRPQPHPLVVD